MYYEPARPLRDERSDNRPHADLLDIADVQGKRIVSTRIHHTVTIREDNATAALEVMSRFAVDPQWLIYLPPTMSPSETCASGAYLEHPREAFAYFQRQEIKEVICEEKHMGSRAVIVVCRDDAVAKKRFGALDGRNGSSTRAPADPSLPSAIAKRRCSRRSCRARSKRDVGAARHRLGLPRR